MKTEQAKLAAGMERQPQEEERVTVREGPLDPYVLAMLGASGLTQEQAKTCVYYAVAAYHLDELQTFPILLIRGNAGTGKSSALEQMSRMIDYCELPGGRTEATLRQRLDNLHVALIDEAENIDGLEGLLTMRYSRPTSRLQVNKPKTGGRWKLTEIDIFGASIVCRRNPFEDVALQSRTIEITTDRRTGLYQVVDVPTLEQVVDGLAFEVAATSDRVMDIWEPLLAVARGAGDQEWLEYATSQIDTQRRSQQMGDSIEPNDAVIYALKGLSEGEAKRVQLGELKRKLQEEFDISLLIPQLMAICLQRGIRVVRPQGYPQAEVDPDQLERLVRQMESGAEA